jgi:hypothetical protein
MENNIVVHDIPDIPIQFHKIMINIIEEAAMAAEKAVITALQNQNHTHESVAKEASNAVFNVHRRHQFKTK